jgi:hypothetical protein
VPWFAESFKAIDKSVCKDRWMAVRHGGRICFAQWEDVGPFRTDDSRYVFGGARPTPNANYGAGIDVSPAVRDYLGLTSLDPVDWRFIDPQEVPLGPWSSHSHSETMASVMVKF